jgi:microcin C transport system substrate-binding protein
MGGPAMGNDAVASRDDALAMHGQPKEPVGFTHFNYVNPEAPKGGTLKINVLGTYDSFHPFLVRGRVAALLGDSMNNQHVYQSLLARSFDEPFTLYPLLAANVSVPSNRQSIAFTLNPKARWQDGKPVTIDDVLFSFDILKKQGRPNHRTYYKKVDKVSSPAPGTIRFDFLPATPNGQDYDREMPLIMGLMPILPKHIWENRPFNETTLEKPIGSGPYRLTAFEVGRSLTFTRDPDYWGRDLPSQKGLYNFDIINVDYFRDDGIAFEAFKAGHYDMRRETDLTKWQSLAAVPAVRRGEIKRDILPHGRVEPARGFIFNLRRPMFEDRALREAIGLVLDHAWLLQNLGGKRLKVIESYFPNSDLAALPVMTAGEKSIHEKLGTLSLFKNSIETKEETKKTTAPSDRRARLSAARVLLQNAGYRIENGKLYSAQSQKPIIFEILLNDPVEEKIALEFARGLSKIGIEAHVRTVDTAQFQAKLSAFDYDVVLHRWINSLSPGNEQKIFWGSAAADTPGSRNYIGLKNSAIDQVIEHLLKTKTREDFQDYVKALDRLLIHGHYMVPLFYSGEDYIATRHTLQRPETTPLYGFILESFWATAPRPAER